MVRPEYMFTGLTGFAPFLERDFRGGRRQHLDIECLNGIWVESIHRKQRSRDQRLKTKVSTRKLALGGRCSMRVFWIIGDHYRWARRDFPTCRSTPRASEPVR